MNFFSPFAPSYPRTLVYMLQSTEYNPSAYLAWYWRTVDFRYRVVAKRRHLEPTKAARLLLAILNLGIGLQVFVATGLLIIGLSGHNAQLFLAGLFLLLAYPIVWAHVIILPMFAARVLVVQPQERQLIAASKDIFASHPGVVIAVAGSYGKTTAKELLLTVLSEGKKVAATPANKNVASSHAVFAKSLAGDEDVLVIEFGEGQPGDVAQFTATTQPDMGVITGIAPAHLDKYKTLDQAAKDILSLADALPPEKVFINHESEAVKPYLRKNFQTYSSSGVMGWKVSNIMVSVDGLGFTMTKASRKLKLHSRLVGRHLVGTLAMAVALAAELGLSDKQIIAGVAKTAPFEHRMQPRLLAGGWVIDDTYNGNLEGLRAGLALLAELPAKRKIYVTPGLVDQGKESERVHKMVGQLIAKAHPDKVVLMQNSVTEWIKYGLEKGGYKGQLAIEDEPLKFYTHLDQVLAVGDVLLMQNDWTDNYN